MRKIMALAGMPFTYAVVFAVVSFVYDTAFSAFAGSASASCTICVALDTEYAMQESVVCTAYDAAFSVMPSTLSTLSTFWAPTRISFSAHALPVTALVWTMSIFDLDAVTAFWAFSTSLVFASLACSMVYALAVSTRAVIFAVCSFTGTVTMVAFAVANSTASFFSVTVVMVVSTFESMVLISGVPFSRIKESIFVTVISTAFDEQRALLSISGTRYLSAYSRPVAT